MVSRAQTETLGFVLVFAIITASIGIVYASGFTGLNDAREFEQLNNAERAFEVFADNIEDITHWNAPSRSTEIKLAGATLTVGEPVDIRINASGLNESFAVRPIIYDADTGERIIYVQGAVFRESGGDAVLLRESSMLLTENRTMIPVIQTRLQGTGSVGGSATVLIRASHSQTTLLIAEDDPSSPIWFNVTTPRASVWVDYLEPKSGVVDCTLNGDTASCELDTDSLHITLVQIDVFIES